MLTRSILLFVFLLAIFLPSQVLAQENKQYPPNEEYYSAQVLKIEQEGEKEIAGSKNPFQIVKLKILDGPKKGEDVTTEYGGLINLSTIQKVKAGDMVVILKLNDQFQIVDRYRLDKLLIIVFAFFLLVLAINRFKGFGSILGLLVSILIIAKFIVPQILSGNDPLIISIIGAFFIMAITIYLSHGFSKQTSIALISTFLSLILTGIISIFFVKISFLTGLGSEDAYSLKLGPVSNINFQGLLLGGMIIGALGVLDDITTSQSSAVFELSKAGRSLKFNDLFTRAFRIGKEHISSLVNTLVLAYAGASLPIFLIFVLNPTGQPMWILFNNEFIAEELIRTVSGSLGLILAVPITTLIASWYCTRRNW